jgi:hypothetical protein
VTGQAVPSGLQITVDSWTSWPLWVHGSTSEEPPCKTRLLGVLDSQSQTKEQVNIMRRRLIGFVLTAMIAASIVAASPASASVPEFKPASGHITGKGGAGKLENTSGTTVECASNTSNSEITGRDTVGHVVVKYSGCKVKAGCPVKSPGQTETNKIVINTTKGLLGTIKTGTGVGVLFEPESGKTFVTLEAPSGCFLIGTTEEVNGSLIGEATPANNGKSSKTGKLVFSGTGGKPAITEIALLGKATKAKLEAPFGTESSLTSTEELEFANLTEVT